MEARLQHIPTNLITGYLGAARESRQPLAVLF
jgi:hypothetical protein